MLNRKITAAAAALAFVAASTAPVFAQSGYDTGTGRSGATANSGEARPDANPTTTPATESGAASRAAPTSGSGGGGSGMARPDAAGASTSGAPEAKTPTKATSTDTKN